MKIAIEGEATLIAKDDDGMRLTASITAAGEVTIVRRDEGCAPESVTISYDHLLLIRDFTASASGRMKEVATLFQGYGEVA